MSTITNNHSTLISQPTVGVYENITPRQNFSYFSTLAHGLIAFADQDKNFASIFCRLIKQPLATDKIAAAPMPQLGMEILKPDNHLSARQRADWLIDQLSQDNSTESWSVNNLLINWSKHQTNSDPKNLVVGIIGVAIPGVTLGLIKRKVNVRVVVTSALKQILPTSKLISRASLGLLEQSLKAVGNQVTRLEPETNDWFFGDKEVTLYRTGSKNLDKIYSDLSIHNIPHGLAESEGGQAIAISPLVNQLYAWYAWGMEPLDN